MLTTAAPWSSPWVPPAADQPERHQQADNQPAPIPLTDPRLTGRSDADLHTLTTALHALHQARPPAKPPRLRRDGHPHAPRSRRPPEFDFPDKVLATILHLRLQLPPETLAHLFVRSRSTIRRAIDEVKPLLAQHGTTITPGGPPAPLTLLQPHEPADATTKIKPAR
jgi:hypothetical protein